MQKKYVITYYGELRQNIYTGGGWQEVVTKGIVFESDGYDYHPSESDIAMRQPQQYEYVKVEERLYPTVKSYEGEQPYEVTFYGEDHEDGFTIYLTAKDKLSKNEMIELLKKNSLGSDGIEQHHIDNVTKIRRVSLEEYLYIKGDL